MYCHVKGKKNWLFIENHPLSTYNELYKIKWSRVILNNISYFNSDITSSYSYFFDIIENRTAIYWEKCMITVLTTLREIYILKRISENINLFFTQLKYRYLKLSMVLSFEVTIYLQYKSKASIQDNCIHIFWSCRLYSQS